MRLEKTCVIAVVNQKGGCGKTTTSSNLAAALAAAGYRTCIVDNDEQCNATQGFGVNTEVLEKEGKYTLADAYVAKRPLAQIVVDTFDPVGDEQVLRENLKLVPSHRGLGAVENRLETELLTERSSDGFSDLDTDELRSKHRLRLKQAVDSLRGEYDFVIIDCPPNLKFLFLSALIACDSFIVPLSASGYDLKALEQLMRTVGKTRKLYNPTLHHLGVLLGRVNPRAKLDRDVHQLLVDQFKEAVFDVMIPETVKLREQTLYGKTILEHAPDSNAAEAFRTLARDVVLRVEKLGTPAKAPSAPERPVTEAVANA